jgi:hypothetical protein
MVYLDGDAGVVVVVVDLLRLFQRAHPLAGVDLMNQFRPKSFWVFF